MSLNRTQIVDWLYRCGDIFTKQSDFLTGLDKEIGDADHATITMQARKGRASYLGERSIGHQDPGATSVLFMVQMLAAAAKE